jgi:hypothetical protein
MYYADYKLPIQSQAQLHSRGPGFRPILGYQNKHSLSSFFFSRAWGSDSGGRGREAGGTQEGWDAGNGALERGFVETGGGCVAG